MHQSGCCCGGCCTRAVEIHARSKLIMHQIRSPGLPAVPALPRADEGIRGLMNGRLLSRSLINLPLIEFNINSRRPDPLRRLAVELINTLQLNSRFAA